MMPSEIFLIHLIRSMKIFNFFYVPARSEMIGEVLDFAAAAISGWVRFPDGQKRNMLV